MTDEGGNIYLGEIVGHGGEAIFIDSFYTVNDAKESAIFTVSK